MTEKSKNELWLAEKFAEAHNRDHGTDYVAERAPAEEDSADAYLTSKSLNVRIGLQISMATTQGRMREESIQDRLQRKISETLMQRGISDCFIVIASRRAPKKKDLNSWHDGVVKLVIEHFPKSTTKIELEDNGLFSPFGDMPFSFLTISKDDLPESCPIVNFFIVKDVLKVESTIQQAIDRKVAKQYSDSANLWLLLQPGDGAHTGERVARMATKLHHLEIFAQVWWVYPQQGSDTKIFRFGTRSINANV